MKKVLVVLLLFVAAAVLFWKFGTPRGPGPQPQQLGIVKPPDDKPGTPPDVKPQPKPEVLKDFTNYNEALAAAKQHKRPLFLYFGAEWCHWCKKMKADTLSTPEVKDKLGKEYVVCYIDTDKDKATARKYKVVGIPAYMVIASDETVITRASGFKSKAEFLDWLRPKLVSDIDP
jgi:thiol:disulfide interchange protein